MSDGGGGAPGERGELWQSIGLSPGVVLRGTLLSLVKKKNPVNPQ